MSSIAEPGGRSRSALGAVDRLGLLIGAVAVYGILQPLAVLRPNRILPGEGLFLFEAVPAWTAWLLAATLCAGIVVAVLRTSASLRLVASLAALLVLLPAIGLAADHLVPEGDRLARVSPGSGFWILLFAFGLLAADALTRLKPPPLVRIAALAAAGVVLGLLLVSGVWSELSILKEYATRANAFWREGYTHLVLAFGSLAAACLVGIPLGILCQRVPRLRGGVLNTLNMVQTIPSIALFGLLIAPLAWLAAQVPMLAAIGVSGIGMAPALVALFAYSLLPVVANTVVGLEGVPPAAEDAARGMGMTSWQRLVLVEFPLAFPVILTGIRIVLVQNIGLATIAALIGGGGFGVFVFQGVGQTAMDLVLLGALPTVVLAFAAAILLDALVDLVSVGGGGRDRA